jgi:hypothetical protein
MPERPTPESFLQDTFGPEGYIPEATPEPETLEPDQDLHPEQDFQPTRFSRYGRYSGRTALAGILLVASGAVMLHEEPTHAEDTQTVAETLVPHTVYRTGGGSVWLHESPGLSTPLKVVMPEGSQFNVDCFVPGGDNVNGNRLWLQGEYKGTPGSVTDYYISTKWNTTQDLVNQGIEECGGKPAAGTAKAPAEQAPQQQEQVPEQKSCYFNMKWLKTDLTFSYEGDHRYYGNAWQAAKNWTDLDAGISIKPAPEGQEGDIVFRDVWTLKDEDGRSWYGLTHVPQEYSVSTNVPEGPNPDSIEIEMSTIYLDKLEDYEKTYAFTHEMGHALGLAHPEACGIQTSAVVSAGPARLDQEKPQFNTPQGYDKIALKGLYAQ